jgi:hypothetical protein
LCAGHPIASGALRGARKTKSKQDNEGRTDVKRKTLRAQLGASLGALTASLLLAGAAQAQTASGSIEGVAPANAEVSARNVDTGFTARDTADGDGDYLLRGLHPGTYEVTITSDGEQISRRVRVLVGETATLDMLDEDEIVVTAQIRSVDLTTSEVATNITQEQIENLPQYTRNFLNFAALAPGVRISQDESEVQFQAGGQDARSVNVFIDGQSQKAHIIDGGVTGQDDSRGNPFPQLAVQEFRIVTQNFKAEFDQASSAIITAVTRSGTNEFEGQIFGTYMDPDWVETHNVNGFNPSQEPNLERQQYGVAIGGPIIEDRLHYFFTYEAKRDDRFESVVLGRNGFEDRFGQFAGVVARPFEEDLYFGKLSWQPADAQRLDLTVTYRDELDVRDVGGQDAAERANALRIEETKANLRHEWEGPGWVNSAQIDYLESIYNPTALNFTAFGQEHVVFRDADGITPGFQFNVDSVDTTIIRLGGRDSNQDIVQKSLTFKDDLTFDPFEWAGTHIVQVGGRITRHNYFVEKEFQRNPFFLFDAEGRAEINGDPDIPVRVTIGSPVPAADVDNTVYGFYVQDDWQITEKLEVNIGLRWDYEDNAFNNKDYSTPDNIRNLLAAFQALPGYQLPFDPDDYITDGDRESYKEAFQPRFGFSYDVFGNGQTIFFGGAGRYYDRVPYNFAFDERFKPTQFIRTINFSSDGDQNNDGVPDSVVWDPIFLTPEGLQPLLDAQPGAGEVFLVKNGAEPPVTDQFNLGLRLLFGDVRTSVTLSHGQSRNGFAWYIGNLGSGPDPRFNGPTPASLGFTEFRNLIFISNHDQERQYNALYLTIDKPYTDDSRWGASFAYTLSEARRNGSRDTNTAPFDFDYPTIDQSPTYPAPKDETHRIVASGILGLPWDVRLSTFITLGSGTPYHIFDATGPQFTIRWNEGRPDRGDFLGIPDAFAFQQIDLRLTKDFELWDGQEFTMSFDVINLMDRVNINSDNIEGFTGSATAPNPAFGLPRPHAVQGRSFQVTAGYRW